jgi:hypothetical protein
MNFTVPPKKASLTQSAVIFGLTALILATLLFCLCSTTSKSFAPGVDPYEAGLGALEQYDTNRDGKISGPELDAAASLKSNLAKIDLDNDNAVTADEIAARIRFWQTTKLFKVPAPVRCIVFHNKQLLVGAEVKLVPEKFMRDMIKTAKGKTSFNGVADLNLENREPGDPPGVGPGFYRVEITKEGQEIPAKYNTKTILGVDTSMDNPAVYRGLRFVLEYDEPKKDAKKGISLKMKNGN